MLLVVGAMCKALAQCWLLALYWPRQYVRCPSSGIGVFAYGNSLVRFFFHKRRVVWLYGIVYGFCFKYLQRNFDIFVLHRFWWYNGTVVRHVCCLCRASMIAPVCFVVFVSAMLS